MTYVPSEDSYPYLPIKCSVKTDQIGPMPSLIGVFAGRTGHFVGLSCCDSIITEKMVLSSCYDQLITLHSEFIRDSQR